MDAFTQDPVNSMSFSEAAGTELLGSTFILGESELGYSATFGPAVRHIDGYGRHFRLSIDCDAQGAEVEIQGFAIEWEPAGTTYETSAS